MKVTRYLPVLLAWLAVMTPLAAAPVEVPTLKPAIELQLLAEQPVAGMPMGNLSGLAWCADALWAVSDRDDDRLYRLTSEQGVWQAHAEIFMASPAPASGLPWGTRTRNWASGLLRGGELDLEGLSCDAAGNRYLVSEAQVAVLQITPEGHARWLALAPQLLSQARARGLLWNFNALFEGVAVDPSGARLWLAAERERRGLLVLHKDATRWVCRGSCVLLSEGGTLAAPSALGGEPLAKDFSGLAFFKDKLYTLDRLQHQVCRRALADGRAERCWSYAATALADERRYDLPYGVAEALWVDAEGAWLGVDNGGGWSGTGTARGDGETRPIIWRFAAPAGGWDAAP